ncbi:MAG TPA: hypothetical protein VFC34_06155, partial [Puia sp.]|nr:hypothetical protein [Puia sp.]
MKKSLHIIVRLCMICGLLTQAASLKAHAFPGETMIRDTIPQKEPKSSIKKTHNGISKYLNIITDRQQRDSLLAQLSKQNEHPPVSDSVIFKTRENVFSAFGGKHIRYIYYNQRKV